VAYNIQPGQSFSVTTTTGQSYNLLYADVAPESGQIVDIYDPSGQLGGNNFEQFASSINGGPIVAGQSGLESMLPNPGGSIGDQVMWAIALALSLIASAIMWLMMIAQKILVIVETAISPIFIGCLMIPALTYLARRFFLTFVSVCCWPLAWGVCNLITKAIIDLAVNPNNNVGLGIANGASMVTGPLAGLAMLIVLACWVIGSTLLAPLFVNFLLGAGGGTATAAIFGATLGAAASGGARAMGGPVGMASIAGGVGSRMTVATQNFARRPMTIQKES
jgi:hypothetical protein